MDDNQDVSKNKEVISSSEQNDHTQEAMVPQPQDVESAIITETNDIEPSPAEVTSNSQAVLLPDTTNVTKQQKRAWFKPEIILPSFLRKKLGKFGRAFALIFILILLSGGIATAVILNNDHKVITKSVFSATVTPFQVITTTPMNNAKDVDANTKITILFNRAVDAKTVKNEFFASPTIDGEFSQGLKPNEVVFTPSIALKQGEVVKIMLHGELKSADGSQLGKDYTFGYQTVLPSDGVVFSLGNFNIAKLDSAQSNTNQHFTLQVGGNVKPDGQVTIYKANVDALLTSFIYHDVAEPNSTNVYQEFVNTSVGTNTFTAVSTTTGLKDGGTVDVKQDTGIYFVVATSEGKQVGWTWVIFNNAGVIAKQDPNKIVLGLQNLDNSVMKTPAKISIYNLKQSINNLATGTITDLKEFPVDATVSTDMIVAISGNDTIVTPLAVPESLADIRTNNPTNNNYFYGLTDKPTYQPSDTVHFAGFIRKDNDAQFKQTSILSTKMYVALYESGTHVSDFTGAINDSGVVSGDFTVNASYLDADQQNRNYTIFGYTDSKQVTPVGIASFTVVGAQKPAYSFLVTFPKKEYLANETVTAAITAMNSDGTALINTAVTYNIYSKTYYEGENDSNLSTIGSNGSLIGSSDATIQLDGNGHATIPIDLSKLPSGNSQVVTVVINKQDQNKVYASGGTSTIVHMGNAVLTFGTGRTEFLKGQALGGRVYATKLNGSVLANIPVSYRIVTSKYNASSNKSVDTTIANGDVQTDAKGIAEISTKADPGNETSVTMITDVKDENNLTVESSRYLYIRADSSTQIHSDLILTNLDIAGSSGSANVGDIIPLTITAPADMTVEITEQRGLIYKDEFVHFKQGANTYSVTIPQTLAPSFTLSLSYFLNGKYFNEGTSINVISQQKKSTATLSADKQQYHPGDTAHIQLKVAGSDTKPLSSSVIIGVVRDSIFSLSDLVAPDMYTSFYGHREITTNSASSLDGIGYGGGGRCGGSGSDALVLANNTGETAYWNANLKTDTSGQVSFDVPLKTGKWRVFAYTSSDDSIVGSTTTTISAN
jgi:uncharacterized protein YfaS (alpha-2-macroglobulin family)